MIEIPEELHVYVLAVKPCAYGSARALEMRAAGVLGLHTPQRNRRFAFAQLQGWWLNLCKKKGVGGHQCCFPKLPTTGLSMASPG